MTKNNFKILVLCLTFTGFSFGLTACGKGEWLGKPEEPPLAGERKAVLDFERTLQPDANSKISEYVSVEETINQDWPQAGGTPSHNMQNLALGTNLKKIWSNDIGTGSKSGLPLTAQPIVMGNNIYTLDTNAHLLSFDSQTGKKNWDIDVVDISKDGDPVISGGIAGDSGFIYVTAGYNEVLKVDASKGEIVWRAKTTSPSRAAPTIMDGRVYVTTLGNSILALNAADGTVVWEFSGMSTQTGLVGAASPAASNDLVIPAFSSGEIYALRAINGSVAWSDNLSSALRLGGLGTLSDIRGLPVVDGNLVYAISFAGKMAAIDLASGARVWQKEISGSKTPIVSGNRLFLISSQEQIISLEKQTGNVVWVSQLARFKNADKKTDPIFWTGPIMGGGRLIAFSSDGRMAEINPETGTLIRETKTGEDVRLSPIIAGQTLYVLSEDGDLIAYR